MNLEITNFKMDPLEVVPDSWTYDSVDKIDHIDAPITYQEFFAKYLLHNRPCVLGMWATSHWKSTQKWSCDDGTPDWDYLLQNFGDAEGPAANCDQEEFCSHPKENKTVKDFIQYLQEYRESGYSPTLACLYLKDWHFTRLFPDYDAYTTPVYFHSDWLNEFWDSRTDQEDDYRFVYIGPKGSWTPFHADVFRSYSWSANIVGKKKWIFFPPGEEECLKDRFGTLVYDIRSEELKDPEKYPSYSKLQKSFTVIQNSGEIIFVPSVWHHQVHNLEDTISINHNWINGCNVLQTWRFLQRSLQEVQQQVQDCRDMDGWHQQCQLIMKASSGIDYSEFFTFLHVIGSKRIAFLRQYSELPRETKTADVSKKDSTALPDAELCAPMPEQVTESADKLLSDHKEADDTTRNKTKDKTQPSMENPKAEDLSKSDTDIARSLPCGYLDALKEKGGQPWIFQGAKVASQPYFLTRSHALFDLTLVEKVLGTMLQDSGFQELDFGTLPQHPDEFLDVVRGALLAFSPS